MIELLLEPLPYKVLRTAATTLSLASATLSFCSQNVPIQRACAEKFRQDSISIAGYVFKTYQEMTLTEESACLEILRAGKVVIRKTEEGGGFSLGQAAQAEYGVPAIRPGKDLTGRGHPDMVVSYYSGGAHCCTSILVFELEPQLRLLSTLETGDSDTAHFEPDSQGGGYSFIKWDGIFAYWHACFLCSPAPKLILKPQSDLKGDVFFRLDLKEMHTQPPTDRDWKEVYLPKAQEAFLPENVFENYLAGSDLWKPMLDWIYGGQADWAWKLVDDAWPAGKPGEGQFLKDFCGQLTRSEYWQDLKPQLGSLPSACSEGLSEAEKKRK